MQINLKILAIPELNSEIAPGPTLMHLQKLENRFKVDFLRGFKMILFMSYLIWLQQKLA